MADARNHAKISFSTTLTLTEVEIRALEALIGYGADPFLKVFKAQLGEAYIRNHEEGIRSFFSAVGRDVLPALEDIDQARRDLTEAIIRRVEEKKAKNNA